MKAIGFYGRLVCCLALLGGITLPAAAQKKETSNSVQPGLDAKSFVFVAQTMSPLRGGLRQLTSYYDLRVSGDSVISNLPYFGRAYVAPMNPAEGGLTFTSAKSEYSVKNGKKGRRDITINTKSTDDTQRMMLTVYDNGTASLQVTSNNRDPVSFNGYVKATGKK